jgi:hypothetical protein
VLLDWPRDSLGGSSLRETLLQVKRSSGIFDPSLSERPPPAAGEHLYEYFWRLHTRRGGNGFSLVPLSPIEIEAWARSMRIELASWEHDAIYAMDAALLSAIASLKT